jgi:hypothetical protein
VETFTWPSYSVATSYQKGQVILSRASYSQDEQCVEKKLEGERYTIYLHTEYNYFTPANTTVGK